MQPGLGWPLSSHCYPQNADVTKQVTVARQAQGDVEREKKELEDSFQRVSEQAQRKVSRAHGTVGSSWGWGQVVGTGMGSHTPRDLPGCTRREAGECPTGAGSGRPLSCPQSQEQAEVLEMLKQELAASKQELQVLQGTLESSTQVRVPAAAMPLPPCSGF